MEQEKKHRSVRLKDKDMLLFDFVAKFGFASVDQLHSYLGGSLNSLKTRLSHLVNDGYLANHRIFFGKPSVYSITRKGNTTGLAIVKEISLGNYEHDMLVVDVFLQLRDRFASHATEKMIRAERGVGVGKSGRIPDLVGYTADEKAIAIEVDRTDKSLDRIRKIIATYALEFKYQEVWFICANQLIFNNLEKVNYSDKIKLFHLKDVLAGKEMVYMRKAGSIDSILEPGSEAEQVLGKFFEPAKPVVAPAAEVKEEKKPVVVEDKPKKLFGGFNFNR